MIFDNDATPEEVASQTVQTLNSAADQVGKADRGYSAAQLAEMRKAMERLSNAVSLKERTSAHRT